MRHVSRRLAVMVSVVLVVLGTAAGAYAAGFPHFGYHKVRSGLPSGIGHFTLTSSDLRAGRPIPERFQGCDDAGVSPQLSWRGAPAGTRSFAVTLFDPDAPTGSGFWHWVAWDIPAATTSLPTGATPPVNGANDGGGLGYTGPCPPAGDITHHYVFTVVALKVPSLELAPDTPAAAVGYNIGQNALASATFTAVLRR